MFLKFALYLLCVPRFCATLPKSYFFLGICSYALSLALSLDADGGFMHFLLFKVGVSLPYLALLPFLRLQSSAATCTTDFTEFFKPHLLLTYIPFINYHFHSVLSQLWWGLGKMKTKAMFFFKMNPFPGVLCLLTKRALGNIFPLEMFESSDECSKVLTCDPLC